MDEKGVNEDSGEWGRSMGKGGGVGGGLEGTRGEAKGGDGWHL